MKVQNHDNKGNPYHDDSNGQFSSENNTNAKEEVLKNEPPSWLGKRTTTNLPGWLTGSNTVQTPEKDLVEMTDEELSAEIKQKLPELEKTFDYQNNFQKMFNGDLFLQCAYVRKTAELLKTFPLNFDYKLKVKEMGALDCLFCFGACSPAVSTIINNKKIIFFKNVEFSSSLLRDKDTVYKVHSQEIADKSKMLVDDKNIYAYTPIHEYGHLFESALLLKLPQQDDSHKIMNDIIAIYQADNPGSNYRRHLSAYGGKNSAEFFAEVFTNMNGGKENKLGAAMRKYLKMKGYQV